MLTIAKFNHYYPKLATRILGFMRLCYYESKSINIDDLKDRFDKSSSIISQNLKILLNDGLIKREFVGNPHLNGPRVRLIITEEGLLIANKFLLEWLSEIEQKTIKMVHIKFDILTEKEKREFEKVKKEWLRLQQELKEWSEEHNKLNIMKNSESQYDALKAGYEQKISKLKDTIKDLASNPNELIMVKSTIKKRGFSPAEFYENYIYKTGNKPKIKWKGEGVYDKRIYQQVIKSLEQNGGFINLFYNSAEWNIRKAEILKRDGDKCQVCHNPTNEVHHRSSATYHPDSCLDPSNLVTICKKCHKKIHNHL